MEQDRLQCLLRSLPEMFYHIGVGTVRCQFFGTRQMREPRRWNCNERFTLFFVFVWETAVWLDEVQLIIHKTGNIKLRKDEPSIFKFTSDIGAVILSNSIFSKPCRSNKDPGFQTGGSTRIVGQLSVFIVFLQQKERLQPEGVSHVLHIPSY